LLEADFRWLARAFNRARPLHPFYLTAWVFLPDHWHGIAAPRYPATIPQVIKCVKQSSIYNESAGMSADEQIRRCGLIVDRVRMPSDPRARI
jgi:REP element-mobilizing transposase RayT